MDNEQDRNEHFQGFAELLWQDLMDVHDGWIDVSDAGLDGEDITHYQQIIAQRAYDLAYHFIESSYQHKGTFRGEIHQTVKMLPDLTEWPNPPQP